MKRVFFFLNAAFAMAILNSISHVYLSCNYRFTKPVTTEYTQRHNTLHEQLVAP
jgi:hypothetical protein